MLFDLKLGIFCWVFFFAVEYVLKRYWTIIHIHLKQNIEPLNKYSWRQIALKSCRFTCVWTLLFCVLIYFTFWIGLDGCGHCYAIHLFTSLCRRVLYKDIGKWSNFKDKVLNCFLYDMLVYVQKYHVKGNLMITKPPSTQGISLPSISCSIAQT